VWTTGARGTDTIEPYHGRMRNAVLRNLEPEVRRAHHHAIAIALETTGRPDAEALAIHWLGAGDDENAAKYMLTAADEATQALAFDRAAELLQRAIKLREGLRPNGGSRDESRLLETKLGDALSKAGRGALAAQAYRSAAEGANAAEALDLERRAAEQLLRSGHFDAGLEAIKTVLARVGMKLPTKQVWVILEILFWRAVLAFRGVRYRERDPSQVPVNDLTRIDIVWSVAFALSLVDVMRGQLFQLRNLLLSLRVGEPYRVARSLAIEVSYNGTLGGPGWKRTATLMREARTLAAKTKNPHAIGWSLASSAAAYYLAGQFKVALRTCDEAESVFREQSTGSAWEVFSMQLFALQSLASLGDLKELVRRAPAALREALDRGDLYAAVNLRIGHPNFYWLVLDDPEAAQREVTEAMRQWSKEGFHLEHYYELYALTNADLYTGQAERAYERAHAAWAGMRRSLITRVQAIRIYGWHMRGRGALAVAAKEGRGRGGKKGVLLDAALADARHIEREKMPWSSGLATLLRAGVAELRGERDRAASLLGRAAAEFDASDMALHAAVARRCLGALDPNGAGRSAGAAARDWMTEQGVRDPVRMTRALAPGLVQ
jgi:hypothetical protein